MEENSKICKEEIKEKLMGNQNEKQTFSNNFKRNKFRNQMIIVAFIWLYLIVLLVRHERRQASSTKTNIVTFSKVSDNKKEEPKENIIKSQ